MTHGLVEVSRIPLSYMKKEWDGADYNSPTKPTGLQSYWKRVDSSISSAQHSGFQKVVGPRRAQKRSTFEPHPYQMSRIDWFSPSDYVWDQYNDREHTSFDGRYSIPFYTQYNLGYSSAFGSTWSGNDDIALLGKLREKIVGSDFDMGVFLGEGKEALSLIAHTATRTRQYLQALRRGDITGIAKSLGITKARAGQSGITRKGSVTSALAEANLALSYGWLPLLKDAHAGAEALAQQLNNPAVQTYRARVQRKIEFFGASSSNIKHFSYDGTCSGQLIAKISEVNVAGLNGLVDPSTVVWELTPWSFVADWFIPIGSYLQARQVSSFTTGTYVKTIYERERFSANSGSLSNIYLVTVQEPSMRVTRVTVVRSLSSSLEVPLPSFKPLSKVPSWRRAANAVSLLVTGFRSR
jgi:hypothetical protein